MRLFAAVLALGLVAACADAPEPPPAATVSVRGVFLESQYDGEAMLVNHEALAGQMPAMRMAFRLATPELLDSLAEGDKVRLTLDSASLVVRDVEVLPAETDLELEPGETGSTGGILLPDTEE